MDSKVGVLRMINTVNTDTNIGRVDIGLTRYNQWNSEIVTLITNRYNNVYHVEVSDWNNSVDHQMNGLIK